MKSHWKKGWKRSIVVWGNSDDQKCIMPWLRKWNFCLHFSLHSVSHSQHSLTFFLSFSLIPILFIVSGVCLRVLAHEKNGRKCSAAQFVLFCYAQKGKRAEKRERRERRETERVPIQAGCEFRKQARGTRGSESEADRKKRGSERESGSTGRACQEKVLQSDLSKGHALPSSSETLTHMVSHSLLWGSMVQSIGSAFPSPVSHRHSTLFFVLPLSCFLPTPYLPQKDREKARREIERERAEKGERARERG